MINAVIYYDNPVNGCKCGDGNSAKGIIKGYIIDGHAGMDDPGYDLVCASVSVLAQTALLGLDAYLSKNAKWEIREEGYMECWLPDGLRDEEMDKAQVILNTMELGLLSIVESYGQYLKVSRRRWTKCCSK